MFSLVKEMDRMEKQLWNMDYESMFDGSSIDKSYNVVSDDKEYTVYSVVPGMRVGDIDIVFDNDTLRIEGERADGLDKEAGTVRGKIKEEIAYGKFKQEFRFNSPIDKSSIKANYKNGVLIVKVQKADKSEALKIKAS